MVLVEVCNSRINLPAEEAHYSPAGYDDDFGRVWYYLMVFELTTMQVNQRNRRGHHHYRYQNLFHCYCFRLGHWYGFRYHHMHQ